MKIYSIINKYKNLLYTLVIIVVLGVLALEFQNGLFESLYKNKIWAHRVNSVEKLEEAEKQFQGVELDVVFELNNYDVNHPPAKSINLSLTKYFKSVKTKDKIAFWLDFKNLDSLNHLKALHALDSIVKNVNIKPENIIVESTNLQYLNVFSKKGFRTSYYYIPNELDFVSVQQIINKNEITYISSDANNYSFLKDNFQDKKLLFWAVNDKNIFNGFKDLKYSLKNFITKCRLLNDSNVEIVLLSFDAEKGNR